MQHPTRLCAALALAFGGLHASPALAQASQTLERVVITGSSIKRLASETALPVSVISREQIERSGATNVEDVLRRVSANAALQSDTTQGAGYAQSFANLRGLGPNSTLVLLNGRRLANFAFGSIGGNSSVDLNSIPFAAIERIEVLRDGASAIYGTDAVGGVINFITRKDYTKGELSLKYGDTEDGIGGKESGASMAFGTGALTADGYNLLLTANVKKQTKISALEQKFYLRGLTEIPGSDPPTSGRSFPGRLVDFDITPGAFANAGANFSPCDPAFNVIQTRAATTPNGTAKMRCRFIFPASQENLPDSDKADAFGRLTFDLGQEQQLFFEASFARNHSIGRTAPVPIDSTAGHVKPDGTYPDFLLPLSSRYFPTALMSSLGYTAAQMNVRGDGFAQIAMRSIPVGPRVSDNTNEQMRFVAGLQGRLAGWDYDAGFTASEAKGALDYRNYLHEGRFIAALATGNINPFGPQDAAGLSLLDTTRMEGPMRRSKSTTYAFDAKASTELMQMGGGAMALALGVDLRKEKANDRAVNADYEQGLHIGGEGTVPKTIASRNIYAVYGELAMPVTREFEATLAARYDKYSDFGNSFNPRAAIRFQPMKELLLRASAGTGFRAPTLWDVNSPTAFTNTANSLVDPDCPPGQAGDPRCETQFNVRLSSDPTLKPEKTRQFAIGAVVEPTRNLTIALDYWHIQKRDQIGVIGGDAIMSTPDLYQRYKPRVRRQANGFISFIETPGGEPGRTQDQRHRHRHSLELEPGHDGPPGREPGRQPHPAMGAAERQGHAVHRLRGHGRRRRWRATGADLAAHPGLRLESGCLELHAGERAREGLDRVRGPGRGQRRPPRGAQGEGQQPLEHGPGLEADGRAAAARRGAQCVRPGPAVHRRVELRLACLGLRRLLRRPARALLVRERQLPVQVSRSDGASAGPLTGALFHGPGKGSCVQPGVRLGFPRRCGCSDTNKACTWQARLAMRSEARTRRWLRRITTSSLQTSRIARPLSQTGRGLSDLGAVRTAPFPSGGVPMQHPTRLCAALALAFGGMYANPALAQASQTLERVVVTGSSIKRLAAETALPVSVLTRDQIEKSGATNVEDVLRRVAAMSGMLSDSTQGAGYATSNANLRGLGANSTLVLLNGRRLAGHPFGSIGGSVAVDLNSIPFAAIDRIEVLRDGASAIYGTDAVGGVVNFITRRDYNKGELTLRYSDPDETKGGKEHGGSLAFGMGDLGSDGYNLLLTANIKEQTRLQASEQGWYWRHATEVPGSIPPTSFRAYPGRLMDIGVSPGAYTNPGPNMAACDPANTVIQVAGPTPNGSDNAKRCRAIYAAMLDNLPDSTKTDLFARGTFKLDADTQWFFEASAARNHTTGRAAPSPLDGSAMKVQADGNYPRMVMPIDSKYFPLALLNRLGYTEADYVSYVNPQGRKFTEVATRSLDRGNRVSDNTNEQFRLVLGMNGAMAGWDYDAGFNIAQARGSLVYEGYLLQQPYLDALATGNVNPFGPNDAAGVALLDGAQLKGKVRASKATTMVLDLKASRELMELGGGAMAMLAVGADLRKDKADDRATHPGYSAGLHIGGEGSVPNTSASRNVAAVYSELAMPFTKQLELTAAARYDHYSDFGGSFNPMLRLRFQPMKELLLRASAGTGFRAPTLWDVNSPVANTNTADPQVDPDCPLKTNPLIRRCATRSSTSSSPATRT